MSSRSSPYTPSSTCKLTTSSVCASRVFPDCESGVSSLVCLCHGSVYCASMSDVLEVCQHARGSSQKCLVLPWMFPGGSSCPRCPEGQDIVPLCQMAQNPQDCTYGSDLFVMMILVCFSLSCDGLLAVFVTINCLQSKCSLRLGFVMEDNMLSLCFWHFYNCTFMNHTVPDKWKSFCNS